MDYTIEMMINKPRKIVTALFVDETFMKSWQVGLIDYKLVSGVPLLPDCVHELVIEHGDYPVTMLETLIKNSLPDEIDFLYQSGEVRNFNYNRFISQGNQTLWIQKNIFILPVKMLQNESLSENLFVSQTKSGMNLFKTAAESMK